MNTQWRMGKKSFPSSPPMAARRTKRSIIMAEILIGNQYCRLDSMDCIHGMDCFQANNRGAARPPLLLPYRPYLFADQPSVKDRGILTLLKQKSEYKDLTDMALAFGEENAVAIAQIASGLRQYASETLAASTSIYARRMRDFGTAVKRYQDALLEYRHVVQSNPAGAAAVEQKAVRAFESMQQGFQNEISTITATIRARKGTPLTNSTRALNIARSSRRIAKLNVFDQVHASRLVKFGEYGKFLGNGLAVIDFGSRVGNIHNSYKAGENWERQMFIESTSFAASSSIGIVTAGAGGSALICLTALTPPGWVLIIAGIGVAIAAGTATTRIDDFIKTRSGAWYDDIIKWMRVK